MSENKWMWISIAIMVSISLLSTTIIIVNENPFEVSFIADDNFVEITNNMAKANERVTEAEINKTIYETKLALLDNDVCVSTTYHSPSTTYEEKHDFVDDDYDCSYGYDSKSFDCDIRVIDWGDSYTYMIERVYTK